MDYLRISPLWGRDWLSYIFHLQLTLRISHTGRWTGMGTGEKTPGPFLSLRYLGSWAPWLVKYPFSISAHSFEKCGIQQFIIETQEFMARVGHPWIQIEPDSLQKMAFIFQVNEIGDNLYIHSSFITWYSKYNLELLVKY